MPRNKEQTSTKILAYLSPFVSESNIKGGKSVADIALGTGLSESTVKKHLAALHQNKTARMVRLTHDQRKVVWFRVVQNATS